MIDPKFLNPALLFPSPALFQNAANFLARPASFAAAGQSPLGWPLAHQQTVAAENGANKEVAAPNEHHNPTASTQVKTKTSSFLISHILEDKSPSRKRPLESTPSPTQSDYDEEREGEGVGEGGGDEEDGCSLDGVGGGGPGGPGGGGKKPRKARTIFTDKQLQTLEDSFERQKYLSVQDRMELANRLQLSDTQVKTWYQNRRTKWKRQSAVGAELLFEASNIAAVAAACRSNPFWANYLAGHHTPFGQVPQPPPPPHSTFAAAMRTWAPSAEALSLFAPPPSNTAQLGGEQQQQHEVKKEEAKTPNSGADAS